MSFANLTRQDGIDFLRLSPSLGIVTRTTRYPLDQADQALADLRAVLVPRARVTRARPASRRHSHHTPLCGEKCPDGLRVSSSSS